MLGEEGHDVLRLPAKAESFRAGTHKCVLAGLVRRERTSSEVTPKAVVGTLGGSSSKGEASGDKRGLELWRSIRSTRLTSRLGELLGEESVELTGLVEVERDFLLFLLTLPVESVVIIGGKRDVEPRGVSGDVDAF